MPKQKGTKSKVPKSKKYFPDSLRNKKLDPSTWSSCKENLSKYLQTEDTKFLFEAIKDEPRLLQGEGKDILFEPYVNPKYVSEYVDQYTVVWETINDWRFLYVFVYFHDPKEGDTIEQMDISDLLNKIGSALVPRKKGYYEYNDGLIHKYPDLKLHYRNPEKYVERFDKIRAAFDRRRKRKKLTNYDLEKMEKRNDAIKVFRELGEFDEEDKFQTFIDKIDFQNSFNVTNPSENTTTYIGYVHSSLCNKCRLGRPKHDTLIKLYKTAKKELTESSNL